MFTRLYIVICKSKLRQCIVDDERRVISSRDANRRLAGYVTKTMVLSPQGSLEQWKVFDQHSQTIIHRMYISFLASKYSMDIEMKRVRNISTLSKRKFDR